MSEAFLCRVSMIDGNLMKFVFETDLNLGNIPYCHSACPFISNNLLPC